MRGGLFTDTLNLEFVTELEFVMVLYLAFAWIAEIEIAKEL